MYTPEAHVLLAKDLTRRAQSPTNLPMDLKFAAEASVADVHVPAGSAWKKPTD